MKTVLIEAFGARLEVAAPGERALAAIARELPGGTVGAVAPASTKPDHRLRLEPVENGFAVHDDELEQRHDSLGDAIADAVSRLHFQVAVHARTAVFLHAGAVLFEDRMILVPGRTFAGKSTLTMALVEAGGVYYSDEYAPIDETGRVHAYRKRPSLRPGSPVTAPDSLPASAPAPRRVDTILGCTYREGATWSPQRLSDGQGALLLVANAVVAQTRPTETARAVAEVMRSAVAFRTERPTVAEAVAGIRRLLAELERPALAGEPS